MTDALPPVIGASVVLVLLFAGIRRLGGYVRRETKVLLAALASVVTGIAVVLYGVFFETNWVPCDATFGRCAARVEAHPIVMNAGFGLMGLALLLGIIAVVLLVRRVLGGDRG